MKKLLALAALVALSGCGSFRTGKGSTYYNTFFGISIESAVMGDGIYLSK
ncbi:MAG: hypothetical protein LBL52_02285 [Rickettsiales bacterium]|jgi:uncharacterized protein YceK|nr:hypothetical protein [Rickettsiales bacterium]